MSNSVAIASIRQRWNSLQPLLREHAFYPLAFCTILCASFLLTRAYVWHRFGYTFLVKNLFLAWLPYLLSLLAVHLHRIDRPQLKAKIAAIWIGWLALLPNAPYIFTDL